MTSLFLGKIGTSVLPYAKQISGQRRRSEVALDVRGKNFANIHYILLNLKILILAYNLTIKRITRSLNMVVKK